MGLFKSLKDLGSGIRESLGFKGHDQVFNRVGQWFNNVTGQTDAFNKSNAAEWEFWNANNAYNDPKAQMSRYEAAGLNPNLIYGSGSASAGNASGSAPSMSGAGGAVASMLGSLLSLYMAPAQKALVVGQSQLAKNNAEVAEATADKIEQQVKGQEITNAMNAEKLKFYQETGIPADSVLGQYIGSPYKLTKTLVNDFADFFEPSIDQRLNTSAYLYYLNKKKKKR